MTQQGRFAYTGTAQIGTTYPDGASSTGDTVWTRLARGLTVSFSNTVTGPRLADLQGAMRLDVGDRLCRRLDRLPEQQSRRRPGERERRRRWPSIDAARAATLLAKHYAEIGASGGGATLTVTPVVATTGTAGGVAVQAGSPAPLAFTLDATSLRLADEAKAAALAPSTRHRRDGRRRSSPAPSRC